MGKGVLLELDGRQAVVLTQQGEFKRVSVPRGTWDIGDEIEYAEVRQTPWAKWGLAAAAAAVMLLTPVGITSVINAQPQAIVTIDINPSIQLVLNRRDQVLEALGINQDGQKILAGVDWKRQPVDEVVAELTDRAVAAHKLDVTDESSAVVVAVAPAKGDDLSKEQADRIRDKAWSAVTTAVREEAQKANAEAKTNVAALEAKAAEKAEAEQAGLTVGKFLIYKELQAQGVEVKPEDLQTMGPGTLLHNMDILPGDVFSQAQEEHGGQPKGQGNGNGNDKKNGSDKGDDETQPTAAQPGKDKPNDKTGNGNSDKQADPGKSGSAPGQSGKAGSNGNQANTPANNNGHSQGTGNKGDKNQPEEKQSDDKKSDDKKSDDKKDEKKGSWRVPILGIVIEKPAFMREKADAEPRAEQPGAGASDEKQREQEKQQQEQEKEQQQKAQEQEKQQKGQEPEEQQKEPEKQQKEQEKQQKEQGGETENKGQGKKGN